MNGFHGTLFDGLRATSAPVRIEAGGDEVMIIDAAGTSRRLRRDEVAADPPIPGVRRLLHLSSGEVIATDDHAAVQALWPSHSAIARIAFMLESRWWTTLAGLALTAASVWVVVAYLLPLAANPVARLISPKFERIIGERSLATFDRIGFQPSELPEPVRSAVAGNFASFIAGEPDAGQYRLEFRKAGIANAFALPGGIIVVTDEMVHGTKTDDELLAVIAHEIGHVRGHHATRLVLQDSGLAVLMTALAGDAVGTTILAAAIPSLLLRSHYSRQFETEADDYAFAMLKRHGRSPQAFADMLRRLQTEGHAPEKASAAENYLSSHPAPEERIRRAEAER